MATKTKTEAATRAARVRGTGDQPVPDDTTSAGQEEASPNAAGAASSENATAGRHQRRPTRMTTPGKSGSSGGDDEPGDGGSDDVQPEDDNSSTRTSELERLLQRGRPRNRDRGTPKPEEGRMRASLGTVKFSSGKEVQKVLKSKISKIPLRFVGTNRALNTGKLIAKSRLVAPGHEDPGLGEFRTDAINLTKAVAASLGWHAWVFDVETAFLSRKETNREIYVRAPKEGLPATEKTAYVPTFRWCKFLRASMA